MSRTVVALVIVALALGFLFFALRPASQETEPQERVVDAEVRGGAMAPEEIVLGEDDLATLRITADRPIDFHLHGYDLGEKVSPDEPAELSFEADLTGRFEIEEESTHAKLGTLLVEPR